MSRSGESTQTPLLLLKLWGLLHTVCPHCGLEPCFYWEDSCNHTLLVLPPPILLIHFSLLCLPLFPFINHVSMLSMSLLFSVLNWYSVLPHFSCPKATLKFIYLFIFLLLSLKRVPNKDMLVNKYRLILLFYFYPFQTLEKNQGLGFSLKLIANAV